MTRSLYVYLVALLTLCGVAQAFISAPASWVAIHPFVWACTIVVLTRLDRVQRVFAGWLVGIAANLAIFAWLPGTVTRFTNLTEGVGWALWVLFALVSGAYLAVFAWGLPAIRRVSGAWWPLAVPAWFVACEFLNPQFFPYFQGVAWYQQSWIFLSASFLGVPWISYLVVASGCWLALAFEKMTRAPAPQMRLAPLAVMLALLGGSVVLAELRDRQIASLEADDPETVRVAIIQSNFARQTKLSLLRRGGSQRLAEAYAELSRNAQREALEGIDVFIWPEGSLRGDPSRLRAVRELVRDTGAEIWIGSLTQRRDAAGRPASYNSAFVIRPDGSVGGSYDKMLRVPFGEYMPFEDLLPVLRRIEGHGDLSPGTERKLLGSPRVRILLLICYEAIHNRFVRDGVALDPDLLVNLTYDAWFGDTRCPHQHLMLSAIQAALHGRPLLRAATTGISAVVDPRGRIVSSTNLFEASALVAEVPLVRVQTLYTSIGDAFAWACVAFSGLALAAARLVGGGARPRGSP